MGRYLDLLEQALAKREGERTQAVIGVTPFTKAQRTLLAEAPPADVLSDDPCPICGSHERWYWLDGWELCRVCLVLDLAPLTLKPQPSSGAT